MNVFDWITRWFTDRGKAMACYKRAMVKVNKHDHQGAIDDYTTTLGMPGAVKEVAAMVLYNRGLAHVAAGNGGMGAQDLGAVLDMSEASVNIKTMARQKLARMDAKSSKRTGN